MAITKRIAKGTPLTHVELDENFTTLEAADAALASADAAHAALTFAHGVSGDVVGTTDSQTLTNKTLTSPAISGGTINNAVIGGTTPAAGNFTALDANPLTEDSSPVAVQSDIGTAPNEIPLNQYLGALAYRDTAMVAVPATASSAGVTGQVAMDSGYLYVCVAANTWKRVAIATW